MASLTVSTLQLCTSSDGWQESLQVRLGPARTAAGVGACHDAGRCGTSPLLVPLLQLWAVEGLAFWPLSQPISFPVRRVHLQNPEAWLRKECFVKGLSVCLDQCRSRAAGKPGLCFQPVLRVPSLRVTAQLPAFAFLEVSDCTRPSISGARGPRVQMPATALQSGWSAVGLYGAPAEQFSSLHLRDSFRGRNACGA